MLFPCLDLVDGLYNVQMCTNTFFQDVSTYYKLDPKKANKWEYYKTITHISRPFDYDAYDAHGLKKYFNNLHQNQGNSITSRCKITKL